jgi:HSP20 family protein
MTTITVRPLRSEVGPFLHSFVSEGRHISTIVVGPSKTWAPPTDVYETDSHIVVKIEIAGMGGDDFQITFGQQTLTVTGCRDDPTTKLAYQQMEIRYGEFRSDIFVPCPIDENAIEAEYQGGFLIVFLPKAEEPSRKVPVTTRPRHGAKSLS